MRSLRTPSRTLKPQALELLTSLVHLTRAQGGWLHISEAQLTLTLNIRPRLWPKLKCTQSENLLHLQGPFGSLGLIFRGSVPLEVGPVLEAVQTSLNQTPLLKGLHLALKASRAKSLARAMAQLLARSLELRGIELFEVRDEALYPLAGWGSQVPLAGALSPLAQRALKEGPIALSKPQASPSEAELLTIWSNAWILPAPPILAYLGPLSPQGAQWAHQLLFFLAAALKRLSGARKELLLEHLYQGLQKLIQKSEPEALLSLFVELSQARGAAILVLEERALRVLTTEGSLDSLKGRKFPIEASISSALQQESASLPLPLEGHSLHMLRLVARGRLIGLLALDLPHPASSEIRKALHILVLPVALVLEEHRQEVRLQAAIQVQKLLRLAESPKEIYGRILQTLLESTKASTTLVALYQPVQDVLEVVAAQGREAEKIIGLRIPRGQGLAWRVFDTGRPFYTDDASQDPQALFVADERIRAAYLGVPLLDPHGRIYGVLSADTAEHGGDFRETDIFFLEALSEAAGSAISRLGALEEARWEAHRAQSLAELSSYLERLQDPEEILNEGLSKLHELSGFEVAAYFEATSSGAWLRSVAGQPPAEWLQLASRRPLRGSTDPLGHLLEAERAFFEANYAQVPGALPELIALGLQSFAGTPIRAHHRFLGLLCLFQFHPHRLADPTPLLEFVAQRLSNALERSQFIRELTSAREQSLKSLGLALEYRDHETKGHTDRVTSLALRLGQHLGLSRSELQALRWGSYLHDIGKIAIPDRILLKPGPLTKEERLLIESHVERGYEMASGLGFLPQATLEAIRYHHERWDGLGYPKGLAGESIPFLARIFAVVDVYDALVSARSYKPAWEPERAVQELRNQAGHQFDPELVSKFLETL